MGGKPRRKYDLGDFHRDMVKLSESPARTRFSLSPRHAELVLKIHEQATMSLTWERIAEMSERIMEAYKAANSDLGKKVKGWKEFGELHTKYLEAIRVLGLIARNGDEWTRAATVGSAVDALTKLGHPEEINDE